MRPQILPPPSHLSLLSYWRKTTAPLWVKESVCSKVAGVLREPLQVCPRQSHLPQALPSSSSTFSNLFPIQPHLPGLWAQQIGLLGAGGGVAGTAGTAHTLRGRKGDCMWQQEARNDRE